VAPIGTEFAWFATVKTDFTSHEIINGANKKQYLKNLFSGWRDPIAQLIQSTKEEDIIGEEAVDVNLYSKPWVHYNSLVLIGDAAHVMDPILAQGASLAMYDAYDLALSLKHASEIAKTLSENWRQAYTYSATHRAASVRQMSRLTSYACNQRALITLGRLAPKFITENVFEFLQKKSLPPSPKNLFQK